MPKERLKHAKVWRHTPTSSSTDNLPDGYTITPYDFETNLEEGEHLETDPALDVNWSKDYGHVQMSIEFPREQWLTIADELREDPSITAKAIYTPEWSRQEINNAIRVLRKARDQAHGADE